jgi:hypothetical protein
MDVSRGDLDRETSFDANRNVGLAELIVTPGEDLPIPFEREIMETAGCNLDDLAASQAVRAQIQVVIEISPAIDLVEVWHRGGAEQALGTAEQKSQKPALESANGKSLHKVFHIQELHSNNEKILADNGAEDNWGHS